MWKGLNWKVGKMQGLKCKVIDERNYGLIMVCWCEDDMGNVFLTRKASLN